MRDLAEQLTSSGCPDGVSALDGDALPTGPLQAPRELSKVDLELEELRRDTVAAARGQGATWHQIGESLEMSRQSAWEYYTRLARRMLDRRASRSGTPDEAESMPLAVDEVTQVRRRHRSHRS
jgi:hypothetical protein